MSFADLLAAHFDPESYNSQERRDVGLQFHPDLSVLWQGTAMHNSGLATTRDMHEAIAEAERLIYPGGIRMTELRTWQPADPNTAFVEWRSAATMWTGREMANGGLSVFEFEDGMVRRIRNFTNTAYATAVERGWEELVAYDTLLHMPAYHTLGLPIERSRPYPQGPNAKKDTDPPYRFAEPLTNEQKVALIYDPPTFDLHGARPRLYEPSDDMYFEWQGTKWMMAGRNYARDMAAAAEAGKTLQFRPHTWLRFTHLTTWATPDQEWVFMEWTSNSGMWTGDDFRNHGMTALWFADDGKLRAHREYCNCLYNETKEGNWREQVPAEQFATRATSKTWDLPSEDWVPTPIFATAER
jgi:ketosteroid isomerase-like protein